MRITSLERAVIIALSLIISICWASAASSAKHHLSSHQKPIVRHKPRATATLSLGDTVVIGGITYTVQATLVPNSNSTPIPTPIPTPTPTPTPTPGPDLSVYGYRNSTRDWVTFFHPGDLVLIEGVHFGATPGKVLVNSISVPIRTWADTEIGILCPNTTTFGTTLLTVMAADGRSWHSLQGFAILPVPGRGKNPLR